MRRPLLFTVVILLATAGQAAPIRRAVKVPPPFPPCSMITGTAAVTFTRDNGATLTPTAEQLSGVGYTYGLTALDKPGTFLAWYRNDLLISEDNGCSWRVAASLTDDNRPDFPPTLTAAKGGRVYAWSDNRDYLVRWDTLQGARKLKPPVAFVGFGVNSANADVIRGGGTDGGIWQSTDGGDTWAKISTLKTDSSNVIYYRFAFDPSDIDHIVAGTTNDGAWYTLDGGHRWRKSAIGGTKMNVFNLVISPADPKVVWAMGLDLAESDAQAPSLGRHLYLSTDLGARYRAVVDQNDKVFLINGPTMAAHPTLSGVLYFVFGTYFQNYGTDLHRYDATSGRLTTTHNSYDGIKSIAFSPGRPNLMYLGLEVERGLH